MWRIYLANLGRAIIIVIMCVLFIGCASRPQIIRGSTITLPKEPPSVAVDTGKIDKSKYPNTTWVQPPVVDNAKRQAWWSFEDVEKISGSLSLWPLWSQDVKELIEGHNKLVTGEGDNNQRSRFRFW